jgi:predicted KAP-like P-loop ATPase
MSKQVMQLRSQQAMLRTAFEGELQRAAAECASGVEALQSRWRQVHSHVTGPSTFRTALSDAVFSFSKSLQI